MAYCPCPLFRLRKLRPGSRAALVLGVCFAFVLLDQARAESSQPYRPDRILVQPKHGQEQRVLALLKVRGATVLQAFRKIGGLQVVQVPASGKVAELIAACQNSRLVEFAEPDYLRQTDLTPDDPKFLDGTLWGLNNFGQNGGTPGADIHATAAWDIRTSAAGVVVAILDTGIRYTHQDLAPNLWADAIDGSHGTNSIAGGTDPNDDSTSGHGTIMAGVIGAVGNNAIGVTGVAWDVQMMACKCFNAQGQSSDSAIIAALDYAVANGAHVISASFDGPAFGLSLSNAIFMARDAGVIFVASAGNSAVDVDASPRYPACYDIDNIVSVAYTTRSNTLGLVSNYGHTNVDIAAPGDQIYSTFNSSDSAYWPPAGLPINLAGTSYAAAYVSGAFALLRARYPDETHTQLIARLLRGADRVDALAGKCVTGGRLNLRNALSAPIRLVPLASDDSMFHLVVSADPMRPFVLQSGIAPGAWTPICTNLTGADGTYEFSEPRAAGAARFYRAVADP